MPCNHATPYRDSKTGEDAPFKTVGPFTNRDMLFCGTARDLKLYTAEEVITLKKVGIFKSLSTIKCSPKLPLLASLGQALSSPPDPKVTSSSPKVELDSSSKKRDHKSSSKSQKYPVSTATAKNLIRSMRLSTNNSSENVRLSIGKGREAGSVMIALIPKARVCSMCTLVNMSMAKHPNVADLLNPTVPLSLHALRNDELKVEADFATVNTDTHAHQSAFTFHHLPSCTLLQ